MNHKYIFAVIIAAFSILTSCEDDNNNFVRLETAAEVLVPNGTTSYYLQPENDNGTFETFLWEEAYFGTTDEITYEVQIDAASGDFTNPAIIGKTKDVFKSISTSEMNQVIRELGIKADQEAGLQVRIKATAGELEKLSVPVSMLVKRYIYDDEEPVWKIKGSALTDAISLVYDEENNQWRTDGTVAMQEGEFNFLNDNVYKEELGSVSDIVYAPVMQGELTYEEGNNIGVKNYDYFVTLDVENMTFTVEEDNYYSLIGTAVSNETTRFTEDGTNLVMKTRLSVGTLNVKFNGTDPIIYGATSASDMTLIEGGLAFDITKEGDYSLTIDENMVLSIEEAAYPAELYMTGGALNGLGDDTGWNWDSNYAQFVPVHSHPELFWAVVWLDPANGAGFKMAPERAWGNDFGIEGDAVDGVWSKGTGNVVVPEANYYTVVVDLLNETIEANPAQIYGIGDVFGGWDSSNPTNRFTIDKENKVIKYDGSVNSGELRMHVGAATLNCDWWQAEFIFLNGEIAFRGTGDDQERVPVSAGNATITLNFMDNTGSIVQ